MEDRAPRNKRFVYAQILSCATSPHTVRVCTSAPTKFSSSTTTPPAINLGIAVRPAGRVYSAFIMKTICHFHHLCLHLVNLVNPVQLSCKILGHFNIFTPRHPKTFGHFNDFKTNLKNLRPFQYFVRKFLLTASFEPQARPSGLTQTAHSGELTRMHTSRWILAVLLALAPAAHANVRLPALFTDNMVLQRDTAAPIWGWADDGEQITIEINGRKVQTTAKDGKFKTKLPKLKASSTPTTLKITGKNSITLNNVLVGEVWIASGQSNMEWPLRASFQSENDIKNAANPNIRLFTVPKNKQLKPIDDVKSSWQECKPDTVPNFSAVAYYFGRDLQKALDVPVGLIHTSWGGSPAEVWMSEEVLSATPEYKRDILDTYPTQETNYKNALAAY
jgi:hypothetical protein